MSCLNQKTKKHFEIIVVDDGSKDQSRKIIKEIKKKYNHLNFFFKNNMGVEKSSNFGINKSKYEYVCRVDADDMLSESFIENFNKIKNKKKYSFFYSNYKLINFKNEIIKAVKLPKFNLNEIYARGDFLATGTIYNKKDILKLGLYSEKKKNCGLENYELILNLIRNGKIGLLSFNENFYLRVHKKNMSLKKLKQINMYGKSLLKKYGKKYNKNKYNPVISAR